MTVLAATVVLLLAVSVVGLDLGRQARHIGRARLGSRGPPKRLGLRHRAIRTGRQASLLSYGRTTGPVRPWKSSSVYRPAAGARKTFAASPGITLHRLCQVGGPPLLGHHG